MHGEIGKVLGERDPLHLISLYYVGIFYTEIFMRTVDLCFFFISETSEKTFSSYIFNKKIDLARFFF